MKLTNEGHRVYAFSIFDETKLDQFSVKILGEYIENEDNELTNTHSTINHLDELGTNYFIGNFKDRGRYQSLVDKFSLIVSTLISKLISFEMILVA